MARATEDRMCSPAQRPWCALLPLALAACSSTHGDGAYDEISDIEDLVIELERAEDVAPTGVPPASLHERLDDSAARLTRFLAVHPDDVPARVTAARVHRLRGTLAGIAFDAGLSLPEPRQQAAEAIDHLDRALERSPELPGLWYWKARVLGSRYPVERDGVLFREPADLRGAITCARRAVASERSGMDHAVFLAAMLVEAGLDDEAAEILGSVASGRHPALQLLADLARLPSPPGAIRSPEDAHARGRQQLERGRIPDLPQFRVRCWIVPASAAEIEGVYAARIPGFRLLPADPVEMEDATIQPHAQYLIEAPDGFTPVSSLSDLPRTPPEAGIAGIALNVVEVRRRSGDAPYRTPGGRVVPAEFGDVFCLVDVIDFRR
jgi:hypothetical protein